MSLLDVLYPRHCLSCGYLGTYLCPKCEQQLFPINRQICFYCSRPSIAGITHPACSRRKGLVASTFLFHYNLTLKKIIKNLKYRLVTDAFSEIIPLLFRVGISCMLSVKSWQKLYKNNILIQSIPLHSTKLKERGFNQAKVIGDYLSEYTSWPSKELIVRIKNTQTQAQQEDRKNRRQNLSRAFAANIDNKQVAANKNLIILVDDVVTSGITVAEAARVLTSNDVGVFALAKG